MGYKDQSLSVREAFAPKSDGLLGVLLELFTESARPLCVGGDLAADGLLQVDPNRKNAAVDVSFDLAGISRGWVSYLDSREEKNEKFGKTKFISKDSTMRLEKHRLRYRSGLASVYAKKPDGGPGAAEVAFTEGYCRPYLG